jgi:vesicle-associated membrane protein 7
VVLAKRILSSIQPGDHKRSFFDKSGRYVFHYMVKDNVTYLCFAAKEHKTAVCFAFLDEIYKRFNATFEPQQIEGAMAYSPQFEEFARTVELEMNRFGHMQFADNKIAEVNEKVEATKQVMKDNVQKVIDRGDDIDSLIEKTDILVQKSESFKVNTKTLKTKIWWKNVKIWVILIVVIIFLVWLILSFACGFDMACFRGGTACFHESTQLTYNGKSYSMQELEKSTECRIPHVVTEDGLSITTSCGPTPLRLTKDHLVSSEIHGKVHFVRAGTLTPGSIIFSDVERQTRCSVTSIAQETGQKYFGMNCLESIVLADNVLCSTFGNFHVIPAVYMKWMGNVVGVHTASRIGDHVATLLARLNLL